MLKTGQNWCKIASYLSNAQQRFAPLTGTKLSSTALRENSGLARTNEVREPKVNAKSEGALAKSKGALIWTKILLIKTDLVQLKIMRTFKNSVFKFKKPRSTVQKAYDKQSLFVISNYATTAFV